MAWDRLLLFVFLLVGVGLLLLWFGVFPFFVKLSLLYSYLLSHTAVVINAVGVGCIMKMNACVDEEDNAF